MKKTLSFWGMLTAVLLTVFTLAGCLTMHILKPVFDAEITAETGATVYFDIGLTVLKVNGIDVKETWYEGYNWVPSVQVVLPTGKVDIVVDLYSSHSYGTVETTYSAKNIQLTLDLESGKKYSVQFSSSKSGIIVYNELPNVNLGAEHQIDFYPIIFR